MVTAVDTSVLLTIYQAEPTADSWMDKLVWARREGALVICAVVASEFYAVLQDQASFNAALQDLGIIQTPISRNAACLAGGTFRQYRDKGGPREHLIPDFLIAAHAQIDADRLAANDRGYLRRYFSALPLL